MSVKIMGQVWDLALPHNKLLVLLALADHADHDGRHAHPSLALLAWKTGYDVRQVRRILRALAMDRLVRVDQVGGGRRRATEYSLHLDNGVKKSAFRGNPDILTGNDEKPGHSDREPGRNPDILPSFQEENPDILTGNQAETRTFAPRNPDISARNPDIAMSAEPSLEPKAEPSPSPTSPPPAKAETPEAFFSAGNPGTGNDTPAPLPPPPPATPRPPARGLSGLTRLIPDMSRPPVNVSPLDQAATSMVARASTGYPPAPAAPERPPGKRPPPGKGMSPEVAACPCCNWQGHVALRSGDILAPMRCPHDRAVIEAICERQGYTPLWGQTIPPAPWGVLDPGVEGCGLCTSAGQVGYYDQQNAWQLRRCGHDRAALEAQALAEGWRLPWQPVAPVLVAAQAREPGEDQDP